jgi:large subunit ribosomal protein L6
MSRIGKMPIGIPPKVKIDVAQRQVKVEGPKGHLEFALPGGTAVQVQQDQLVVTRPDDSAQSKAFHGLSRAILKNMVQGVAEGFTRQLEIQGVGFKAAVQGRMLTLNLGYSHPIHYPIPDQIKITIEENTKIKVEGPDRQVVGRVAAEIRSYYPPEPYKGKGVRYAGELVRRKEGKTVQ